MSFYDSILRGLGMGQSQPMMNAPALVQPKPQPPGYDPTSIDAPPGQTPMPEPYGPAQPTFMQKIMSDPDAAKALLAFGSTALQARDAVARGQMGVGAGLGAAANLGANTYEQSREKRISLKRQRMKEDLEMTRLHSSISREQMALEDARAQREALQQMAGGDADMLALGRLSPEMLIKAKHPELATLGQQAPAAIQIANEVQKARKAGDIQRVNDLLGIQKVFEKGQVVNADGTITNQAGFTDAVKDTNYAKGSGREQGVMDVDKVMKPQVAQGEAEAKLTVEKQQKLPGATALLRSTDLSYQSVDDEINKAKKQASGWTTGFVGKMGTYVPGTDAYDLEQRLKTIKSNLGFDKLQDMRNNSPTGGALGQVSTYENENLQSVWGNLLQSQSEAQFKENLDKVQRQREQSWKNIKAAYKQDYGTTQGFVDPEELLKNNRLNPTTKVGGFTIRRKD